MTHRPTQPPTWGVRHAAIGYLVGLLASSFAYTLTDDASTGPVTVLARVASLSGLWIGLLGAPLVASRGWGSGSLRDDFGFTIRAADLLVGLIAGIVLQLVAVPIVSWPIEQIWSTDVDGPTRELLDNTTGPRPLLYAAIAIGAPIVEELFFRGLLLRALTSRLSNGVALIVDSMLFAVSHFKAAQTPALFVVGLTFGWLALRSGRLGPAITAHAVFNTTALLITLGS